MLFVMYSDCAKELESESVTTVHALCVRVQEVSLNKLGVGRTIILAAVCEILQ